MLVPISVSAAGWANVTWSTPPTFAAWIDVAGTGPAGGIASTVAGALAWLHSPGNSVPTVGAPGGSSAWTSTQNRYCRQAFNGSVASTSNVVASPSTAVGATV